MTQLTIFDTPDEKRAQPGDNIGLLNRKRIVAPYDGIADFVATAIPGEDNIHILPGKHQTIIPYKKFDLTYEQYREWLSENNYEERDVK